MARAPDHSGARLLPAVRYGLLSGPDGERVAAGVPRSVTEVLHNRQAGCQQTRNGFRQKSTAAPGHQAPPIISAWRTMTSACRMLAISTSRPL